jgi:hypothetical protein
MSEADAVVAGAYRTGSKRVLPRLDDIRVAAPCDVSWDEMVGNGRARHCDQCKKQVFNISAMSRADAEVLLREHVGICVRFYRRFDGTVMTSDCPVGIRHRLSARAIKALITTAALGALAVIGIRKLGSPVVECRTYGVAMGALQ